MKATHEWIAGDVMIPDLLTRAPEVRSVLDRYGRRGCGGPQGPSESLEFFSRAHDVPLPQRLGELRQAAEAQQEPTPDMSRLVWVESIYRHGGPVTGSLEPFTRVPSPSPSIRLIPQVQVDEDVGNNQVGTHDRPRHACQDRPQDVDCQCGRFDRVDRP